MTVHAFASWGHYADHIAPIWKKIPEPLRGQFVVGTVRQKAKMAQRGIDAILPREKGRTAEAFRDRNPIIVAGFPDLRKLGRRPVCFVEHGAGQTYLAEGGKIHGGYSGGQGRQNVNLFICPNKAVAQRNKEAYPDSSVVAVGSPRLDDLYEVRNVYDESVFPTLGISFHWECRVAKEAGSAFSEFRNVIPPFVRELKAYGMDVVGHGHPKSFSDLGPWWELQDVEALADWEEVVSRVDAYMIDNSSTIFEAAALDIPVLLMESSAWRKDVEHGLRFWEFAHVGPSVKANSDLRAGLADALDDRWSEVRKEVTSKVYEIPPGADHLSSRYAAQAIIDWMR